MLYFLPTKAQAIPVFISFHKMIEKQLNVSIQCLQSNNGEGGLFLVFHSYLEKHGITHRFSYPHTPQQNGRVEQKIRHVVKIGLALSTQASLPSKYACYLINL